MVQPQSVQSAPPRRVADVMTREPAYLFPDETVLQAARLMADLHVGSLPVCDRGMLVGILTDRDIAVRSTAAGHDPGASHVGDAMSGNVQWCAEDEPLEAARHKMEAARVRRLPVVDQHQRLVGVISLGDLATKCGGPEASGRILATISTPSAPAR